MLKIPAFISNKVERNGDNCILTLTTKQAKIVAIIGSVALILALVLGIWGIVRQVEIESITSTNAIAIGTVEIISTKTEVLDKKIQNLNQISEENKQMLKGAESGTPAQGGGDGSDPKQQAADESEAQTLTAAQLSARLSKMDKDAQKLLVSFYTMRNILRDGGAQDLWHYNPSTSPLALVVLWITRHLVFGQARALLHLHFGSRVDPVTGAIGAFHEGVDIADDYGTQIVATAAGCVTLCRLYRRRLW